MTKRLPTERDSIDQTLLHPLRFNPIYQYRPWGGRRLGHLLSAPLPDDSPVGEAWILSDRDDHPSLVADGPFTGMTVKQLMEQMQVQLMGRLAGRFKRFPLLLKFLDVRETLSVQVHPCDTQSEMIPAGETGKTEGWVVLEAGEDSRIYAGLKPSTTAATLREAIAGGRVEESLASFEARPGDGILVKAGTVHSLSDVVVFEVQENSDVTFRLYDWNHVDPQTGQMRPLQIEQAMACIKFDQLPVGPVAPELEEMTPILRERLLLCEHFGVWRLQGRLRFEVGAAGLPRVLVCLAGKGRLEQGGARYAFGKGDVVLLPAMVGVCTCKPEGAISLLEISLPEGS
jgi:mannose-6-phosphate isomerase